MHVDSVHASDLNGAGAELVQEEPFAALVSVKSVQAFAGIGQSALGSEIGSPGPQVADLCVLEVVQH
jgi:hypothetical protein